MRIKPFREWSDDTMWIVLAVSVTLAIAIIVWFTVPG